MTYFKENSIHSIWCKVNWFLEILLPLLVEVEYRCMVETWDYPLLLIFFHLFGFLNVIDNFFNSSTCFMKTAQSRETPTGNKNPRLLCCCSRLVFSSAAAYKAVSSGEKKIFFIPHQNQCGSETSFKYHQVLRWSSDFLPLLGHSGSESFCVCFSFFVQPLRPVWRCCRVHELTTVLLNWCQHPELRLCPTAHPGTTPGAGLDRHFWELISNWGAALSEWLCASAALASLCMQVRQGCSSVNPGKIDRVSSWCCMHLTLLPWASSRHSDRLTCTCNKRKLLSIPFLSPSLT